MQKTFFCIHIYVWLSLTSSLPISAFTLLVRAPQAKIFCLEECLVLQKGQDVNKSMLTDTRRMAAAQTLVPSYHSPVGVLRGCRAPVWCPDGSQTFQWWRVTFARVRGLRSGLVPLSEAYSPPLASWRGSQNARQHEEYVEQRKNERKRASGREGDPLIYLLNIYHACAKLGADRKCLNFFLQGFRGYNKLLYSPPPVVCWKKKKKSYSRVQKTFFCRNSRVQKTFFCGNKSAENFFLQWKSAENFFLQGGGAHSYICVSPYGRTPLSSLDPNPELVLPFLDFYLL